MLKVLEVCGCGTGFTGLFKCLDNIMRLHYALSEASSGLHGCLRVDTLLCRVLRKVVSVLCSGLKDGVISGALNEGVCALCSALKDGVIGGALNEGVCALCSALKDGV